MKIIISIVICIFCLGLTQSYSQTVPSIDRLKLKAEEKRIADSTYAALLRIEIEHKRDSIVAAIKKRQEERVERQDSIRKARQKQRALELENKRAYLKRKKERAHIRDSIKQESQRTAAARKAYLKSQKKKGKNKKEENDITNTEVEKGNQEESQNKAIKNESKEQTKLHWDSISSTEKKEAKASSKKDPRESIVVTNDVFVGTNSFRAEFYRDPPSKKTTYFSFQFGTSNYLGDLGGNSQLENNLLGDVNFKENTYFYGFSLSHMRREVIGLRLSYIFGSIAGSDKNTYFQSEADPSYAKYLRNLDFKSK